MPVAQLDRVLASEAKGRGFNSRQARHLETPKGVHFQALTLILLDTKYLPYLVPYTPQA